MSRIDARRDSRPHLNRGLRPDAPRCLRLGGILAGIFLLGCPRYPVAQAPLERSTEEVVWSAEYKGWACGGLTPQIMPDLGVEGSLDLSGLELGLVFFSPRGRVPPDQLEEVAIPGNRFLIRGHYYFRRLDGRKVLAPRFDLIGWVPIAPFQRWRDGPSPVNVEDPEVRYARFDRQDSPPIDSFHAAGSYQGCGE